MDVTVEMEGGRTDRIILIDDCQVAWFDKERRRGRRSGEEEYFGYRLFGQGVPRRPGNSSAILDRPMKFSVPKHILSLKPYEPGKPLEEVEREYGIRDSIKLASNENPLGPSPLALIGKLFGNFISGIYIT